MQTRLDLIQAFNERAKLHDLRVDVVSDGTFNSQIAIVGEAPGEREITTRIPFSGGAGKVLWDALRKYGIGRHDVYLTNVIKRQVSLGKEKGDEHLKVSKGELAHWIELVRWELEQLPNVRYVLLLGNFALEAFTGEKGITHWRGSVWPGTLLQHRSVTFVATYNPAMVLREPKTAVIFNFDIAKLQRVIDGKYKMPVIEGIINPSYDDAVAWIERMKESVRHGLPISVDIEVMANETACVGLSDSNAIAMCINFRGMFENRYNLTEERDIRRRLQALLADEKAKFIMQNASFDWSWLWFKDRIRTHRVWFDTLLAHHVLYPTLPHDLGFLTAQYTDHPYYKDEKAQWRDKGDIDGFWQYNVKDVCITRTVHERLHQELRQQDMERFYFDHVMRLQEHLVAATVLGVKCDLPLKDYLRESIAEDVAKLQMDFFDKVHIATGNSEYFPNPRSPKQLMDLFFRRLKITGRGMSTDEDNRKRMFAHPRTSVAAKNVIVSLDKYLTEHKFLSTYAEMAIDQDGRMRCEYKQYGTKSAPGRLSSSKLLWGAGMNLQNQPVRARAMFVADEGYGFGYFDLSQAEARYVAWDANIESWIEQFEQARLDGAYDAHRALAADMFGVDYDEVPKKDTNADGSFTIRYIAKRCRHGLNYRMGADRLATVTGLSFNDAQEAYDVYHRRTPELRRWWDILVRTAKTDKSLFNSFGRRLLFLGYLDEKALESVVAYRPQSTIGDKVCRVWYEAEEDPTWPADARICLNIHDALICLAPLDKLMLCLSIMKKYAQQPIQVQSIVTGETRSLIIPAETKVSVPTSWRVDEHTIVYEPDEHGLHRWHGMKTVEVEEAK